MFKYNSANTTKTLLSCFFYNRKVQLGRETERNLQEMFTMEKTISIKI